MVSEHSPVPRQRFTDLNHVTISLQVGNFQSEMLNWGFFEPRWWRNYLHTHSFFEICYAFAGKGLFRIAEQEFEVREGHLFIAKPGEVHEIISSGEDPLGIYFWAYKLTPGRDQASQASGTDLLLEAFFDAQRRISSETTGVLRTLELLTEEIAGKKLGYQEAIKGLVAKLLLDTARSVVALPEQAAQFDPPVRSPEEAIVQAMVRYLRDNIDHPLLIRDLAAQSHLSKRHTSRLFQKVMGVSIREYLTHLRIQMAAQLLLDWQIPIKEVAQETGYPDVRYFTTLFHQRIGMTPAAFRKQGGTRFVSPSLHPSPDNLPGYV